MKIESKDADIESLLDSGFFHIPRFQRPYSWDDENITEFWQDIVNVQSNDYFIGSMVVYKKSKLQYGVVDGQQRLTTITILLCVIRDYFNSLGFTDLARGIHQLIERKDRNNKNEYVLKTETSFPYFQEYIQKFNEEPDADINSIPEESNLRNAHSKFNQYIKKTLNSVDEDSTVSAEEKLLEKKKKLLAIRNTIFNLKIIFVSLENEDDAYIIFETLNTRGKDLALTDLVKNHFTKHMKAKGEVDHTKLKWEKILRTIHGSSEDISTDNYIYHFWASRYEAIPQKKLFPKFKKAVTKVKAKDHIDYLVKDSSTYRSLFETSYSWTKNEREIAQSLSAMQIFKLSQPTPATLSLVRAYRDKIIKYPKLLEALRAIENFHFQFTAITSSRSSGGISAMYSSFGQKLFKCENSQNASIEISELKKKLRNRVPSFDEFKVAFKEVHFTNSNSKQKFLVRYILKKYSGYYNYKYPVDFDDLTIEHLHSQSKTDSIWNENIIGKLGNLIFIDEKMNESLSNNDFKTKQEKLKRSKYSIPDFVFKSKSWTPEKVLEHTEIMAKVAYEKIWKI